MKQEDKEKIADVMAQNERLKNDVSNLLKNNAKLYQENAKLKEKALRLN